MHKQLLLIMTAAVAGATLFATSAVAQQKTVKACELEWRANKAANQAAGVTEKAYVEKCRAANAAAPPSVKPAATKSTNNGAATKTAKECQAEWRATKAANQAAGITEKAYVEKCRAGVATAQPATQTAPTSTAPAAKTTTAPPAAAPAPARAPATGTAIASGQFSTEAQAKSRCPRDTVVWVNLDSKIYHFSTSRNYGHTKDGAYMCERDTAAAGFRAAKNEKHP